MTQQWTWATEARIMQVVEPVGAFLIALLGLLLLRHVALRWLYGLAPADSLRRVVLDTLRVPAVLWCIAAAVQIALRMSIVPARYIDRAATSIVAFLIVSLSMVLASASVRTLTLHGRRRGIALALSGLSRTLIRVVIFLMGAIALLRLYNVNITPLLTALGVGGLAVALALQDTLANFFAGIHILIEEPVAVGNIIRLTENEEGVVTDIGWRTTRLRTGRNNIVVIPNTKITSGILTNYSLGELRVGVEVPVMVAHEADPDEVSRMVLEEVLAADGVLAVPEPTVFFTPGMLLTHLQLVAAFSVSDVARQGPVGADVRLRIHRRLRKEGVPLPHVGAR
ncbi:MAG: mechanosensitive ion channel family protein [Bryobacteraceae bacterium]